MKTLYSQKPAKDILKVYREQEDKNDHASNYVILAMAYGTEEELKTCINNREERNRLGYVDRQLATAAHEAANKYYKRLVRDAVA